MELLNINELTTIAAETSYDINHERLLADLRSRYPKTEFILVATHGKWSFGKKGLVDKDGNRISDHFEEWITDEYHAAGRNARTVWEKHQASGLILTETQGTTIYIAVPYSTAGADAFFQIEIDAIHEITDKYAFEESWSAPEELEDLLSPFSGRPEPKELSPYRYQFKRLTNVRRFLQEMSELERADRLARLPEMQNRTIHVITEDTARQVGPRSWEFHQENKEIPFLEMFPDWLNQPKNEARFFQDWEESTAGKSGARLCEHWFLQLRDYTDPDGKRSMGFTPQWADADGGLELPEITSPDREDAYGAMGKAENFDKMAGYQFAWFFYGIHGNRVDFTVGETIARGVLAGKIRLPEYDEKVLKRWFYRGYGF